MDVSDPLSYLEQSLLMFDEAKKSNVTAMIAAGAFPGMSNVLSKEASVALNSRIQDVRFNYFTAGLGGSGVVNLYITNLGFGEPMVQYDQGNLRWFVALSGERVKRWHCSCPSCVSCVWMKLEVRVVLDLL